MTDEERRRRRRCASDQKFKFLPPKRRTRRTVAKNDRGIRPTEPGPIRSAIAATARIVDQHWRERRLGQPEQGDPHPGSLRAMADYSGVSIRVRGAARAAVGTTASAKAGGRGLLLRHRLKRITQEMQKRDTIVA